MLTKVSGFIVVCVVMFTHFSLKKWDSDTGVIKDDVKGYYAYLPSLFIHNDLKLENLDVYNEEGSGVYDKIWFLETKNGTRYIKYSCGLAILYSPFFAVAHMSAEALGATANGYSWPYKIALIISSIVFLIIGLVYFSKLLRIYFNDAVTSISILTIFLGTNVYHFYTYHSAMSHGYSLAIIAMFLYYTIRWLDKPKLSTSIIIGFCAGFMTLIRPVDIIFLLALPLLSVSSLSDLKARFILFLQNKLLIGVMILFFIIALSPQLIYFKHVFGTFLSYSYSGESFYFLKPHLFDVALSFRNGWLIYSPLMIFSILGVFFLSKYFPKGRLFVFVTFIIYYYVIASWWCWWYVGLGNRAMINLTPLLVIPLAAFFSYIHTRHKLIQMGIKTIVLLGIILNLFQSLQYEYSAIHWGGMTKDAYLYSFGKRSPAQLFDNYVREPHTESSLMGLDSVYVPKEYTLSRKFFSMEDERSKLFQPAVSSLDKYSGEKALHLEKIEFGPGYYVPLKKAINRVFVSAWVKNPKDVYIVLTGDESNPYHASANEVVETDGEWTKIFLYARIPNDYPGNELLLYIWNQGKNDVWIDDYEIKGSRMIYAIEENTYW